ncbi:MAG: hypothetical protein AAF909_14510 [Pseudomonadota bacterium]
MPGKVKIASCCYCGRRATLTLGAVGEQRELVCAGCGAPLRRLKAVRSEPDAPTKFPGRPEERRKRVAEKERRRDERREKRRNPRQESRQESRQDPRGEGERRRGGPPQKSRKKRREKRRRGPLVRFFKEVIDELEDLFD